VNDWVLVKTAITFKIPLNGGDILGSWENECLRSKFFAMEQID
jgi:hypothetical protein